MVLGISKEKGVKIIMIENKVSSEQIKDENKSNPLGSLPLGSLLLKFAIPSIIAMLVTGLYNIVDQIFIGNYVGPIGNGATNVAFPFSTLCTAASLLFGIGGAAAFNLNMGAGNKDTAGKYVGNAITNGMIFGVVLSIITEIFLTPLLKLCGATSSNLSYAIDYTGITAIGFPFLILSVSGGHVIRADGKPMVAMICNIAGAMVNTALDALFVIGLNWGMKGAALATVIGQMIAAGIAAYHILHFKTVKLSGKDFIPNIHYLGRVANLGMSQGFNQVAMMVVQIVSNNELKIYGARSVYGEDIPIAVVGIATKLAMLYFSFCIGISHALQPIASYNYGAGNYDRTRNAFNKARNATTIISVIAFLLFQIFPREIISLFGRDSELYFEFAVRYIRIYLFCTFINNVQPITSTFFSAIGKPKIGLFLSLTRQILFLLPLIILLPFLFGIDGMLYAGPVADVLAFSVAMYFMIRELKDLKSRSGTAIN